MSEEINDHRRRLFGAAAMTIAAAQLGMISFGRAQSSKTKPADLPTRKVGQITPASVELPIEGEFPSLGSATAWLNSPPLTAAGLRGKVVLIDFCTYSCINWLRSLPYVRAWAGKYKDQGLVVIGVHTAGPGLATTTRYMLRPKNVA
jgi:hypothetical protein